MKSTCPPGSVVALWKARPDLPRRPPGTQRYCSVANRRSGGSVAAGSTLTSAPLARRLQRAAAHPA